MKLSFQLPDVVKRVEARLLRKHTTSFCYNQPNTIQIETTSRCDLSCVWCFRHFRNPMRDMQISEFKSIIEDIGYAERIYPFGGGEPLLHPQFDKMITIASLHANFVGVSSNGMLLDKDKTERLNVSGLTEFTVSIDSPRKREFALIRREGDLDKVKRNVAYFSSHSQVPLRVHAVLSSINLQSAMELPKMASELGAKKITFNLLHPTPSHVHLMPEPKKTVQTLKKLKQKCAEFKLQTNDIKEALERQKTMCKAPLFTCFIDSEGYITPCCNHPMLRLGNVLKEGFRSCWNNKKMRAFRKALLAGIFPKWCQTFCMIPRNWLVEEAREVCRVPTNFGENER